MLPSSKHKFMVTARTVHKALLAIAVLVAALVSPLNTWAAAGNGAICQPSTNCTIGEFLYDDSYQPITNASCNIISRNPDGTVFLNSVSATAASDGFYSYGFTAPTTTGVYRSQLCCTVGGNLMCLDKSFEVKTQTSLSQGDVANAVWNANRSSYKTSGSFGEVLQNALPAASDIATATWGYSTRTASGFWNLVNDIWKSPSQTSLNKDVASIKTMLDQKVNVPIIQNALEEDKTPNLQSKLDETKTRVDQLFSKQQYIRSKTGFIETRWKSLSEEEIVNKLNELSSLVGQEADESSKNSIFAQINWARKAWGWKAAEDAYIQTKDVGAKFSVVKKKIDSFGISSNVNKDFSSLISSIDKLGMLETPLLGNVQQVRELVYEFDAKSSDINSMLANWNSHKDVSKKVNELAKEVEMLNKLPKATYLFAKVDDASSEKSIKNKVLDLRGVIDANKKLLAKNAGNPISNTWLDNGSIIFKTLVTNPSQTINQTVPVKIYLPSEVKKENIINVDDGLSIVYDPEKNQYYYQGSFTIGPGETKTLQVRVDDNIFIISKDTITSMQKQADELSKPLNNTSYFAQGVTLKSSINVALDKITELQKSAVTPEEKIRAFREAKIELDSAKTTMAKLQELASTAGSAGALFGFVGGTQTLAVWGLIIIMIAGFVFLALYMREIRKSDVAAKSANDIPPSKGSAEKHTNYETPMPLHNARSRVTLNFIGFLILFGTVVALASGFVGNRMAGTSSKVSDSLKESKKISLENASPSPLVQKTIQEKEVLGSNTNKQSFTDKKFRLIVPSGSLISVYTSASLDSQIVTSFKESQDVKKLEEHDQWVKIAAEKLTGGKPIEGWVDKDFIEISSGTETPSMKSNQSLIVDESLSGFVWIREEPLGKQIAKVYAGDKLKLVQDGNDWMKVELGDGTVGWIFKKYTTLK